MDLKNKTKEQLIKQREDLIKTYIGDFNKPQGYFNELEQIEHELLIREGII
jgi:hypothetical protein